MEETNKSTRPKRGPEPERLKIEGDPGEVLDKLLGVDKDDDESESAETKAGESEENQ